MTHYQFSVLAGVVAWYACGIAALSLIQTWRRKPWTPKQFMATAVEAVEEDPDAPEGAGDVINDSPFFLPLVIAFIWVFSVTVWPWQLGRIVKRAVKERKASA